MLILKSRDTEPHILKQEKLCIFLSRKGRITLRGDTAFSLSSCLLRTKPIKTYFRFSKKDLLTYQRRFANLTDFRPDQNRLRHPHFQ